MKKKELLPEFEIFIDKEGKDPDKRDYFVSNEKLENQMETSIFIREESKN